MATMFHKGTHNVAQNIDYDDWDNLTATYREQALVVGFIRKQK